MDRKSSAAQVICAIRARIIEIADRATSCPELRRLARLLAAEFAEAKHEEGLEAPPTEVDVEGSARHILREQLDCLNEARLHFPPKERKLLERFRQLVVSDVNHPT